MNDDHSSCGDGVLHSDPAVEECDDGNTAALDGCSPQCMLENPTSITWEFYTTPTSLPEACRLGVANIEVSYSMSDGTDHVELFGCYAMKPYFFGAPIVTQVTGRALDASGAVVATAVRALQNIDRARVLKFYELAGYIHASWEFRNAAGDNPGCPPGFTVTLYRAGKSTSLYTPCLLGKGHEYSPPLEPGDYDVTLQTATTVTTKTVTVSPNNAVTDVPLVVTI